MFYRLMSLKAMCSDRKFLQLFRHAHSNDCKYGFTLSEVLITLLIIGVVASVTLPSIINDTQDAELRSAWKKAFASINQAYGQILLDNGGTFINAVQTNDDFRNIFQNKMNFITTCNNTSCGSASLKKFNGTTDSYSFYQNLVLNDGSILGIFQVDSANCTHSGYVYSTQLECGWFLVDVNGKKSPNQWGKDIYGIWVMKNHILPWGANPAGTASATYTENTCTSLSSGYGCGAKYLYN